MQKAMAFIINIFLIMGNTIRINTNGLKKTNAFLFYLGMIYFSPRE